MSKLLEKSILDNKEWRLFITKYPSGSVFQTPAWAKCMINCSPLYESKPFLFKFTDGTQVLWSTIQYPIKKFFLCLKALPFGIYGRPLVCGSWSQSKGQEILNSILSWRNIEMVYAEDPLSEPLDFKLPKGIVKEVHAVSTHVLELESEWNIMWEKRFSSRIRNQIRRAEKEGLVVRQSATNLDILEFYGLYELTAKRWGLAKAPHSQHFFTSLLDSCPGMLKLLLVEDNGKCVAGGIFVEDNESVLYWFSAMDEVSVKKFPVYLLLGHVIRDAIDKKKKFFNMGASGELVGVKHFKEMWGARPKEYNLIIFRRIGLFKKIEKAAALINRFKN